MHTSTTRRFLIARHTFDAAYMSLHRSGELQRRAALAHEAQASCGMCPRACEVDRNAGELGVCKTGQYARVCSYFPHLGEEDCLRGWEGSGTIFFASCSLRCAFCQNFDISQIEASGVVVSPRQLAAMMLELQGVGCHNINLVTPGHVIPQFLEALVLAAEQGLRLPIVYNTSGYDAPEGLRLLDGIVDVYMPDFKLWDPHKALRYLKARDYPDVARQALKEMHRQVGDLAFDEDGLARRGVLVRHLVMPDCIEDTAAIMRFLAREVSADTYVNIMPQYYPSGKVSSTCLPEINRRLSDDEYQAALHAAGAAGVWRLDERHPRKPWVWG